MESAVIDDIDYDSLLEEVENGSQGAVANIIHKLREKETNANKTGRAGPMGHLLSVFTNHLESRLLKRNVDIESTCNENYDSFAESTKSLLRVKDNVSTLQNSIKTITQSLDDECRKFDASTKNLTDCIKSRDDIDRCIHSIQNSLPVLEQYMKVRESIRNKRHYHALKSLEYLEKHQFQIVNSFAFCKELVKEVPNIRQAIKTASLNEVTDFLEDIRRRSLNLGDIALKQTASLLGMDIGELSVTDACSHAQVNGISSSAKTDPSPILNSDSLQIELKDLEKVAKNHSVPSVSDSLQPHEVLTSHSNVESITNFGAVYRCLHIHTVLNEKRKFEQTFCSERKKQIMIIMSKSPHQLKQIRDYRAFFGEIVGFFVVEDHLRHTLPGAQQTYQQHLDEQWTNTCQRVILFVKENVKGCKCADQLILLKNACVLFTRTMVSLGFSTASIAEIIEIIRVEFERILSIECAIKFQKVVEEDNYTAIHLVSEDEMTQDLSTYPGLQTPEIVDVAYPKTVPYSYMVPKFYVAFREYADQCISFTKHMDLSWSEVEDNVNRAVNNLLVVSLLEILTKTINDAKKDLLRLIQLSINIGELENTCKYLVYHIQDSVQPEFLRHNATSSHLNMGKVLNRILNKWKQHRNQDGEKKSSIVGAASAFLDDEDANSMASPRSRLQAGSLFRDVRSQTENFIYANLKLRVDEFCELANYQEASLESSESADNLNGLKEPKEPSDYIVDMMSFLKSIFFAFTNLPPRVAQTACIQVCRHVNDSLMSTILGNNVKMVSDSLLKQISLDLAQCESFAKSDVTGLDKSIILELFLGLRQLLTLARKEDWLNYIEIYQKTPGKGAYSRVMPKQCIGLLKRLLEAENKKMNFMQQLLPNKEGRNRRKFYEDIQKKLKELNTVGFVRTG